MLAAAILTSFGNATAQSPANTANAAGPEVYDCVKEFGTADWKILLADLKTTNPENYKRFYSDPAMREDQVKNLRELFALGCQAVKDGRLSDPIIGGELANTRNEIVAVEFGKIAGKASGKGALESVGADRVDAFYKVPGNEAKFDNFLKVKLALLERSDDLRRNATLSDEEKDQARQVFAKISLLDADSKLPTVKLEPGFQSRVGLLIKLQQTQFLARLVSEAISASVKASDAEIAEYIRQHPEFSPAEKRAKAEGILARARAGEDFAKLADENSDDPGNISEDGKKNGGLYTDVPMGKMVPVFEAAALALEPGQVSAVLTESDYGYHIIKLEKRSGTAAGGDLKYDVRHILISTGVTDPADPSGREMPVNEYVRNLLESEKEGVVMARIVKDNPIVIAAVPPPPAMPVRQGPVTKKPVN